MTRRIITIFPRSARALCVAAAWLAAFASAPASAGEVLIAVAANFLTTAEHLAERFGAGTSHDVTLAGGSTGGLYAQIALGAGYDILLSADQARPARLEAEGRTAPGARFTYATGRISLWSADGAAFTDGPAALRAGALRNLAIANPDLAPYGLAARQALERLGVWEGLSGRLVLGQNMGQTIAMIDTGNAEMGIVATSFLMARPRGGSRWDIPAGLHAPIRQDAVLLAPDNPAAAAFLDFLQSDAARAIIIADGYEAPG